MADTTLIMILSGLFLTMGVALGVLIAGRDIERAANVRRDEELAALRADLAALRKDTCGAMVMTAERGGAQVSRIGQDVLHLWRRVQSTERAMKQAVLEIARLDRPNLPEILPPRADATIPAPPRLPRPADEQGNETTFVSRAEMAVTRSESEPPPASRTLPSPSPKGRRGR